MDEQIAKINAAMKRWRQGDFFVAEDLFFVHLADLACPITSEATEIAQERVKSCEPLEVEGVASSVVGYVVITQTCDIARECTIRSYIELSPLVRVDPQMLNEVRLLRRPAFAYIPGGFVEGFVADLDRAITVEKSILHGYKLIQGCNSDSERRTFADALARHKNRAAFPDDFNQCIVPLRDHLKKIHRKGDAEGLLIQSVGEIRVTASPNWDAERVSIFLWFILSHQVLSPHLDVSQYIEKWRALFENSEKYSLEAVVCRLEDMKASDYVDSDRLDLDQLSVR